MGSDYLGLTEGQTKPKKKKECCFVIYTPGGEHIIIECDRIRVSSEMIKFFNLEKDEEEQEQEDIIAIFYTKNIVGWEQVR